MFTIATAGLLIATACSESRTRANHWDFGTVTVGGHVHTFYFELGADSAVLGFSVAGTDDQRRYFPLYASTYRGLPAGVLTVFTSPEEDAMWIASPWPGYEVLGYCRPGTNTCLTRHGVIHALSTPTPDVLGGTSEPIPALDRDQAKMVATLTIPKPDD